MDRQSTQVSDAVEMLKKDHENVTKLFQQFERASSADKAGIATQIFKELEIHSALEEEIFYPAVRDNIDPKDLAEAVGEDEEPTAEAEETDEEMSEESEESEEEEGEDFIAVSYEEHQVVKDQIQELRKLDPKSEEFRERFEELRDDVLDHVSEEEDVMFPVAKLHLPLEDLGGKMLQRRTQLSASLSEAAS